MNIPEFPKFIKLNLDHKEPIEQFVSQYPPYSDFNFSSLWTYNTEELIEVSFLNGNLVILFQDYIDKKPFYSFLGHNHVIKTTHQLIDYSINKKYPARMKLIPEIVINSDRALGKEFNIVEDPDNHDYILSVQEISELKGKKYYDKRNLINRFRKKYPNHKIATLDLSNKVIQNQIIDLFVLWEKKSKKKRQDTENELKAIKRILSLTKMFNILGIGIYHDKQLIGFVTYEVTHNGYGIISFEKGDIDFEGIYPLLNHEVAKDLDRLGFKHINYEQDLGIAGLKKAKSLWRPVHYLKKYIISPIPPLHKRQ